MEALRSRKQCLSSGEPVQPILEQMQDQLHVYYHEYCTEALDFLLAFQLKKLLVCIKIFDMTLAGKG